MPIVILPANIIDYALSWCLPAATLKGTSGAARYQRRVLTIQRRFDSICLERRLQANDNLRPTEGL